MRKLEIDPEFRDLLPALSEDEFKRLEESMIDYNGCYDPIQIWGNTIIDGHNRYAIMQKHPEFTKFETKMLDFADKHEAIYWILQNQMGRRNLDGIAYDLMVARAYKEQLQIHGGDRRSQKVSTLQNEELKKNHGHTSPASDKVASDFGTSSIAVQRARMLDQGLYAAEEVSPGFTNKVLSGEVKAPKTVLRDLRKLPTKARKGATEAIKSGNLKEAKGIIKKQESTNLDANVRNAIDLFETAERDEMITLNSELSAMADDFIKKIDRMNKLHKDAIQTAEGKAVMIENLTKVKNAIDERMKDYEN